MVKKASNILREEYNILERKFDQLASEYDAFKAKRYHPDLHDTFEREETPYGGKTPGAKKISFQGVKEEPSWENLGTNEKVKILEDLVEQLKTENLLLKQQIGE